MEHLYSDVVNRSRDVPLQLLQCMRIVFIDLTFKVPPKGENLLVTNQVNAGAKARRSPKNSSKRCMVSLDVQHVAPSCCRKHSVHPLGEEQ